MRKKTQAESGLKSKILVGVMILFSLFLIGNVSAEELITFDNVKSYDVLKQEVTITNTFGIGRDIAKIKLNTPLKVIVPRGYQKIAEFEVTNYKDYVNAFEEIKFYNYKEYLTSKDKAVSLNRQYDYKFKGYETITITDYKTECSDFLEKNGTKTNLCYETISGTHEEQKEVWLPLEKLDFLSGEVVTIGIFTEVQKGDNVEWIPEFYGVKINEWASWEESLNVGLVSYYKLDETSGTTTYDSVGLRNGTLRGNVIMNTPGKIGGSYNFSQSRVDGVASINNGAFTINLWVNHNGTFPAGAIAGFYSMGTKSDASKSYAYIGRISNAGYGIAKQGLFIMAGNSANYQYIATSPFALPDNKWVMLTAVYNTSSVNLYVNGSLVSSVKYSGGDFSNINSGYISGKLGDASQNATGSNIDEIGIWSRALSYDEIQNLWNSGAGNTYLSWTDPTITLNSPEDYFNSSTSTISFNFTGYVYNEGEQIDSITLYVDNQTSETNTTNMANGTTYFITKAISSGYHNWSVSITGTNETSGTSSVRFFNITIYSPDVTLTSPIAYYNTSNPTINFEAEATDDFTITNVSLYLDGVINETNTSGVNGTYEFTKTLSEGEHYWSILAYDNDSNPTQSGDRYFTIDYTNPVLSTTGITDKYNSTLPINLTWSLFNADLHPDQCWYYTSENSTNISVTCNSSTITNFTSDGSKTIYYFGNDSMGNEASGSSTLSIGYYPYTQSATPENVGVGNAVTFTLYVNGTNVNTLWGSTNATINFNGTTYTPDTTDRTNQNYTKFTKTLYTTIGNSTGANTPYNWSYSIKNTTDIPLNVTTTTNTIKVYTMAVRECLAGDRYILNASIKDEKLKSLINASLNTTNIEIDLSISSRSNTSATWNFSKTWLNNNTVYICVPPNVLTYSSYKIDFTVGYKADDYVQEFYYMDNGTIDSTNYFNSYTTNPLSLYDLALVDSTTFLFKFKDENNLEVDDAIVHVYRKYIGDGIFREVERAKQDNNGETHVHLVEEDVIYYFLITQYGNIIYTSSEYNAKCLDTPCQIQLTASTNFVEFPTDYNKINGTSYTLTSSKTTRTVTLNYGSNATQVVNLSLFKVVNGVVTYINTTSETGTSGSLTLSVPLSQGNETFFASIFANGEWIRSEWIDMKEKAQDYFGTTGAILGGLLVLTLIFMAISEGVMLIVVGIVAIFVIVAMQLVDMSWLAIISIVVAGALIIWKMTHGGNKR